MLVKMYLRCEFSLFYHFPWNIFQVLRKIGEISINITCSFCISPSNGHVNSHIRFNYDLQALVQTILLTTHCTLFYNLGKSFKIQS